VTAYPKPPSTAALLKSMHQRLTRLEAQVTNRTLTGLPPGTYAATVIANGGMESGVGQWVTLPSYGLPGTVTANTATPITGGTSLRVTERAYSSTPVAYCPTGQPYTPTPGVDVFPTGAGDQWLAAATIRTSVDGWGNTTLTTVYGTTPGDCFVNDGANQDWIAAAVTSPVGGTALDIDGLTTCPDGRAFVGLVVCADDLGGIPVPWTWDLDTVTLQLRL